MSTNPFYLHQFQYLDTLPSVTCESHVASHCSSPRLTLSLSSLPATPPCSASTLLCLMGITCLLATSSFHCSKGLVHCTGEVFGLKIQTPYECILLMLLRLLKLWVWFFWYWCVQVPSELSLLLYPVEKDCELLEVYLKSIVQGVVRYSYAHTRMSLHGL